MNHHHWDLNPPTCIKLCLSGQLLLVASPCLSTEHASPSLVLQQLFKGGSCCCGGLGSSWLQVTFTHHHTLAQWCYWAQAQRPVGLSPPSLRLAYTLHRQPLDRRSSTPISEQGNLEVLRAGVFVMRGSRSLLSLSDPCSQGAAALAWANHLGQAGVAGMNNVIKSA